ncbi:hypothetical protein BKA70DRAFT_1238466 [Coprinopsis sp. MPI-PUGE-AT-0042]|nr:hypothetical protein BKA70DRAFT_1238466 [Coprinopsis sp. MPI-PUGE-AT-0042]
MPPYRYNVATPSRHMPSIQLRSLSQSKPSLEHHIRRIQAAQVHTAYSQPEILHWDAKKSDLSRWFWPASPETGERVTPSDLEGHRRTHHFMAPCCLCAITLEELYVEAKIGLVAVAMASGSPRIEVNGEVLQIKVYPKRVLPLASEQLVYISDFDRTAEASSGLYQAIPSSGIWMRGAREYFTNLWARGLQEDAFWSLFIQCSLCRMVMPNDVFFGVHGAGGCKVQDAGEWLNNADQLDRLDEDSISGDTEIIQWDSDDDTDSEVS